MHPKGEILLLLVALKLHYIGACKLFRWLIYEVKILSCSFPNILDHDKDLAKMPNQIPAGVFPLPWVESEIGEIMFQQIQGSKLAISANSSQLQYIHEKSDFACEGGTRQKGIKGVCKLHGMFSSTTAQRSEKLM